MKARSFLTHIGAAILGAAILGVIVALAIGPTSPAAPAAPATVDAPTAPTSTPTPTLVRPTATPVLIVETVVVSETVEVEKVVTATPVPASTATPTRRPTKTPTVKVPTATREAARTTELPMADTGETIQVSDLPSKEQRRRANEMCALAPPDGVVWVSGYLVKCVQPTPVPQSSGRSVAPNPTATKVSAATVPQATTLVNAPTGSSECPSDGEMQAIFGFDTRGIKPVNTSVASEGEVCKWTLQAVGVHVFEDVPFVEGWQLTVTLADESVRVYYGDGESRDVMGVTFRYVPAYDADHWVRDAERLMAHEFNFGWSQGRNPNYVSLNGNLSAPRWNDYDGQSCPENTVQVAGLVGGEPMYWEEPEGSWGAWTFSVPREGGQPAAYLLLTAAEVPDSDSWIDYWNSDIGTADRLDAWRSLALADASFHCHSR